MCLLCSCVSCCMCQNPKALAVLTPGPHLWIDCTLQFFITPDLLPDLQACLLLVRQAADSLSLTSPLWPTALHTQAPLGPSCCPVGLGHWYNHNATPMIPFAATNNVLCLWLKSLVSSVSIQETMAGLLSLNSYSDGSFPAFNSASQHQDYWSRAKS